MAEDYTIILHGWSDCSGSFTDMKQRLEERKIGTVETILYGDYESREDNITFNDVVDGLQRQLIEKGVIREDGSADHHINVVIHSTGGLVVRHWIWRYYADKMEICPIKRIVMLAPANFGSPLAHRGKSFLGRLVKGRWKVGDFLEVGRRLLDGLELASPYQWELAHRDLFYGKKSYYNKDQIQLTILTGIEDYSGIRGWVNKPGTDGTIVIAGTSLDSVKLKLDFCDPENPCLWSRTETAHDFSFGVLPGLDHGSIVGEFKNERGRITDLTAEALLIKSAEEFERYQKKLDRITEVTYSSYIDRHGDHYSPYQQFLVHGVDDHGSPVTDFSLEFFVYQAEKAENGLVDSRRYINQTEDRLSRELERLMLGEIHTHTKDSSFRRLLVNLTRMEAFIEKAREELGPFVMVLRIYVPGVDKGIYYNLDRLQNVVFYHSEKDLSDGLPSLFFENTTTLIELEVDRRTSYVKVSTEPNR
ncbi:MAG: hypothetical protein LAT80_01985 [Balneolaceae bacterium]|nr:hypothetical protein [Balneolaceae bacterium]